MKLVFSLIGCFVVFFLLWIAHQTYNGKVVQELWPGRETLQQVIFRRQASGRSTFLKSIDEGNKHEMTPLYNILVPEVHCKDLVRVGNLNDGGKWACNPNLMKKENCSIYSFGLNNEMSFDTEIQQFNGNRCRIYGYDSDEQSENTKAAYAKINGKTKAVTIAQKTAPPNYAIADLVRENNDSEVEVIKMDIEGAEHSSLAPLLEQYKPCQIYLEMHGNALQMKTLLIKIASFGYYLFSYEINGVALSLCEYSFIHESCMERYDVMFLASYIRNAG